MPSHSNSTWNKISGFLKRQTKQIKEGGISVFWRKTFMLLGIILLPLALPVVLTIRLIRPWLLVRWGTLHSSRIGHFAGNTELYLCGHDAGINVPKQRHVDLFSMEHGPISNQQLAIMWKRVLWDLPSWILAPISRVNQLIPGGAVHEIGNNMKSDRDVYNLLNRFPPHLGFTPEEEDRGKECTRALGIPQGARFVCLIVRDNAYLDAHHSSYDWSYHSHRDSDIQNYTMAAEELADCGYFVIRMGVKVREAMKTAHLRIIDYATNGMRSDFMDIYLGAKCEFCISVGTGFDSIPSIFRRPIVYVNYVPVEHVTAWDSKSISIFKKYWLKDEHRFMTFREIIESKAGRYAHFDNFKKHGIELIENTPEEIRDAVVEMDERLKGTWQSSEEDEELQKCFWALFKPNDLNTVFRGRIGTEFLRQNRQLL
jgi:putative glycosyltransferase (TIGR04372 family)